MNNALNTTTPTYTVLIENKELLSDLTSEITSFSFEDSETDMDMMEITVLNRWQALTDNPLLQEGNVLTCQFGYVGNLSGERYMVLREIGYQFPEDGIPSITLKAFDASVTMNDKQQTRVWNKPAPGYRYWEIAAEIAAAAPGGGLLTVIQDSPKDVPHLSVPQSGIADAAFLDALAKELGYQFYVENRTLHFHEAGLADAPTHLLVYGISQNSNLLSFTPDSKEQGSGGAQAIEIVGVDPRTKTVVSAQSSNSAPSVSGRVSLGQKTNLSGADSRRIVPTAAPSESRTVEPPKDPQQQQADEQFKAAEMKQIEATAVTFGDPALSAKTNVEIQGVGQKFGGVYHVNSVRHTINDSGYRCELKLRRNAVTDAGAKAEQATGQKNEGERSDLNTAPPPTERDSNTGDKH